MTLKMLARRSWFLSTRWRCRFSPVMRSLDLVSLIKIWDYNRVKDIKNHIDSKLHQRFNKSFSIIDDDISIS